MILLPNESHCSRLLRIRLAFPQISKPYWLAVSKCCPIPTDLNCKMFQINDRILNFFPSNLSRFHSVQILIYVTQTCICDTKLNLISTFTAFHSDTQQFNLFPKRHGWYVYSVLSTRGIQTALCRMSNTTNKFCTLKPSKSYFWLASLSLTLFGNDIDFSCLTSFFMEFDSSYLQHETISYKTWLLFYSMVQQTFGYWNVFYSTVDF